MLDQYFDADVLSELLTDSQPTELLRRRLQSSVDGRVSRTVDHNDMVYRSKMGEERAIMLVTWLWAQLRSKDPRTKVGCCIHDEETGAMHFGYNGFPVGIPDFVEWWDERDKSRTPNKYQMVIHAEINALARAKEHGFDPENSVAYITHWSCHRCFGPMLQHGIRRVRYAIDYPPDDITSLMIESSDIRPEVRQVKILGLVADQKRLDDP